MAFSLETVTLKTKTGIKPKNAIILCHGYEGNGKNIALLANYWRGFLPHTIFMCPNAPYKCKKKNTFMWFNPNENNQKSLKRVIKSVEVLNKFLDEVKNEYNLQDENLIIGGFSQGCMITLKAGIRRKKKVKLIIGYSGKIIDKKYLDLNLNSKPNICLFHGDQDKIVKPDYLYEAKKFLKSRKFNVKAKMFKKCDHKISREGANLGLNFIKNFF